MIERRKKWIIAAMLLGLAGAVGVWSVCHPGPEMRLELRFLSYTNERVGQFLRYTNETGIPGLPEVVQVWQPPDFYALVLVTNTGGIALELGAGVNATNYITVGGTYRPRGGFESPSNQNLPRTLKPGETMIITIGSSQFLQPWSTEITAQRRGLRDRLYAKVWEIGNPTLQNWIARFPHAFVGATAYLGPITNLPPEALRQPSPRVARP